MFYIKHPSVLIVLLEHTSVKEFQFVMDMLTYKRGKATKQAKTIQTQLNNGSVFTSFGIGIYKETEISTWNRKSKHLYIIILSLQTHSHLYPSSVSYVNIYFECYHILKQESIYEDMVDRETMMWKNFVFSSCFTQGYVFIPSFIFHNIYK